MHQTQPEKLQLMKEQKVQQQQNHEQLHPQILKTSVRNNNENSRKKNTIGNRKTWMIKNYRNKNSNKIIVATLRRCKTNLTNNNKRNNRMLMVIAAQTTANKTEYLLLLLLLLL